MMSHHHCIAHLSVLKKNNYLNIQSVGRSYDEIAFKLKAMCSIQRIRMLEQVN